MIIGAPKEIKQQKSRAAADPILGTAANVLRGKVTCEGVAEAFGMDYVPPDKAF